MARVPDLKRLHKEDFPQDSQPLVEQLAFPLNSFMEQTQAAFSKGIDFRNLNQELITLDITVDINGIPKVPTKIKSSLTSNVAGLICINAVSVVNPAIYPVTQPFIIFAQNGVFLTVRHISGLQADNRYSLRLLSIGF